MSARLLVWGLWLTSVALLVVMLVLLALAPDSSTAGDTAIGVAIVAVSTDALRQGPMTEAPVDGIVNPLGIAGSVWLR